MERVEEIGIVIVGGGIVGLATALALHRKGIESVVLERWESLRATGAAIDILTNGWRALHQLGVASNLRHTANTFHRAKDVWLDSGKQREVPVAIGEARCLRRSDLLKALADALPYNTLRFGCQVISIRSDPLTSSTFLHLDNGHVIKAKILIGCDGGHSVIADYLGLDPLKLYSLCAIRGFTNYPNGHEFPNIMLRLRGLHAIYGRIPVDSNLVYWFVSPMKHLKDSKYFEDTKFLHQKTLEFAKEFSNEVKDMIKNCDMNSLSITHLRYRLPSEILIKKFRKGTVTVAGDAMHIMGPFSGQGGSAGIEDAIVLARHLSNKLNEVKLLASINNGNYIKGHHDNDFLLHHQEAQEKVFVKKIGEAFDGYVKERRIRLASLSLRSYLIGSLMENCSIFKKILCVILFMIFYSNPVGHTYYDCGQL